uniref:Uncharacterized protein n=1 Tax=Arundo donax TaxID=35708 RepID=A0A0A9BTY2_ARUDO
MVDKGFVDANSESKGGRRRNNMARRILTDTLFGLHDTKQQS